ncbi:preprotein translocase subunit SecY [Bradyrhizobium sp. Rc3b]|uniref:preprotein translocase subunit SecY n=1 Tax=unclassified Bradyrhizobium TaxID=2631580 RepID=UPI0008E31824|nr:MULTISPECIES: preprotein translocase subunit SecY [unclassified Bradyrhizobium]MBB4375550.1 preprotein translocase subunit SecY [Bradyrhizobium sp. SBR1B]SFN32763.1 preprotein translocase subunit SecY [Bradyrhizobium sp. Rc3b]
MSRELARRIAFTIGALLLFRLGTQIPVAGVAVHGGFAANKIAPLSIFSLSLFPYLTAAILVQLVAVVWRRLRALERSGEAGRRKLARITLILTLLLATFQAFGIASTMRQMPGLVVHPGDWFVLSATVSLVGGVFVLIWLSEQITRRGIGNGLALVLTVSIVASLPSDVATLLTQLRRGAISGNVLASNAVFLIVVVALIVFVERARRNLPVQFAARRVGERSLPSRSAVLPLKINSAGYLLPATVAPWAISLPVIFAGFIFGADDGSWVETISAHLHFGEKAHIVFGSIAVFALAFVYTAFVIDPDHAAESLARQGGVIPGVTPGEATASYLDRVVSLTTVIGASYLTALSLIPEVFLAYGNALVYKMGGGAALIVVCTILDLQTQVREVSLTNPGGVRR